MSVHWIRELGDVLVDDTHVLLTRRQYESLGAYQSIGQPTNPSVGRCFRTGDNCFDCRAAARKSDHPHLVVFVEQDADPDYVRRVGRLPLFLDD